MLVVLKVEGRGRRVGVVEAGYECFVVWGRSACSGRVLWQDDRESATSREKRSLSRTGWTVLAFGEGVRIEITLWVVRHVKGGEKGRDRWM